VTVTTPSSKNGASCVVSKSYVSYEFLWIRRTRLYLVERLLLYSSRVRIRIRFSVWLVSGYTHVFILLSVVVVTLPYNGVVCS